MISKNQISFSLILFISMFIGCTLFGVTVYGQTESRVIAFGLIPKPLKCIENQGVFEITPDIKIYAEAPYSAVAELLAEKLHSGNQIVKQMKNASIVFSLANG